MIDKWNDVYINAMAGIGSFIANKENLVVRDGFPRMVAEYTAPPLKSGNSFGDMTKDEVKFVTKMVDYAMSRLED